EHRAEHLESKTVEVPGDLRFDDRMRHTSALLLIAALMGCPASKPGAPVRSPQAEVEISGEVALGAVKATTVRVYASREACSAWSKGGPLLGKTRVLPASTPLFMLEVFVPQGTLGHVCGLALDEANQVVGTATYEKNPVAMKGEGEVMVSGVELRFTPLAAPQPLPGG